MKHSFHIGIWSHRDVRRILPGRTLAMAGNALVLVTLLLQSHDRGVGTVGVAALLVCMALPAIATMGIAGRLTDSADSRVLLAAGIAVQVLAAGVLAWSPPFAVTHVGVVALQLGQAVIGPVWSALLPRVVGDDAVGSAIAWQQGLGAVAAPIGAALGGVLYGAAGPSTALLTAAAIFAVLLVLAVSVRTRRHLASERAAGQVTTAPPPSSFLTGLRALRGDRVVWPTFLALLPMVVLVEGVNAVEVFLVRDDLGATHQQYGLGEVAAGIGGVLGAVLAGRLTGDRDWVRGTIGGFALACGALALAGAAPSFWVYLVVMVLVAGAAGVGNASNGALIITRTPEEQRGRVGATLNGIARTGSVLALALGGLVGMLASPRTVFIAGGILGMATVLALGARSLRASAEEQRTAPATTDAVTPISE